MQVAVLGGGLAGACVALELALQGVGVDLYEQRSAFVTQASAQNEGKIHLGYVYANDATRQTAHTMIKGALAFWPLMRRWLGSACDSLPVSHPFVYAVHRQSLLSIEQIEDHFTATHALWLKECREREQDYFGRNVYAPVRLSRDECAAVYDTRMVQAAYYTSEVSIDPEALAAQVRTRLLAEPNLRGYTNTVVHSVERYEDSVSVKIERDGDIEHRRYDHVVNTSWESRLALDQTAGLTPPRPWLYRIKHYLRWQAENAGLLPSTTIVLGGYGDVVAYGNGGYYLSWYPAGMRGMSAALRPPAWLLELDKTSAHEVRCSILDGLAPIIPSIAKVAKAVMTASEVKSGIIFAWGQTDIDDPGSGLHERSAIGPQSYGRYHTVDTGKLTMAPLFGKLTADRIVQQRA